MTACEFGLVEACQAILAIPGIDVNIVNEEGVCFWLINPQRTSVKAQEWMNASSLSNHC
jgi:hypothetical protein